MALPDGLLDLVKCFQCYGSSGYVLDLIELAILKRLAEGMPAITDPQTLLDEAKCFQCYASSPYMLQMMRLGLLLQISISGGGGGGGGGATPGVLSIYWEASHADNNPPADPTKAYMRRFLNGDNPVIWEPDLGQWL